MFTGIIESVGKVRALQKRGGDLRLTVAADGLSWAEVKLGDSIACNGVCLTAVDFIDRGFVADVSVETLNSTTLGDWQIGDKVNLELALTPNSRLGGHIVSGHVDGVGEVIERRHDARSERFVLRAPENLAKYIAKKGSITIDGTSLTVNEVQGASFDINIVPHTLEKTVIGDYQSGTRVNLEVDLLARYLERLLMGESAKKDSALSEAFLAEHGFLR